MLEYSSQVWGSFSAGLVNVSTESEHLTILSFSILVQDFLSFQHYAYIYRCIKNVRNLFLFCSSFFCSHSLTQNLILNLFECKQIPVSPFSKWNVHTCSETQSPDVLITSRVETVMAVTFLLCCIDLSHSAKHVLLW